MLFRSPVVIRYRLRGEARTRTHRVLFTAARQEVRLPGRGALLWAYPNVEETGLYRVALDSALLAAVSKDYRKLAEVERAGLLNHLWARVRSGEVPVGVFLDTLYAMRDETSRMVLEDASAYLRRLESLIGEADRPAFAKAVNAFFGPHWKRLGWAARKSEGDDARLSRAAVLSALAAAPSPALGAEAERKLNRYLEDPTSIEPALAGPLLEMGARLGGPERFEEYRRRMVAATTPEQRDLLMGALADFRQPEFAGRLIDITLSDQVRGQDVWKPLTRLLDNPATQGEAWKLIRQRWPEIREKGGPKGATRVIEGLAGLARPEWLEEIRAFFAHPANQEPSAARSLDQTLEAIELGIQLREKQAKPLSDRLRSRK